MPKAPILYLVHRIPYPPNKGDKVRSFNILKVLAEHYEVHLGTFVDLEEDWQHVGKLDQWCASVKAIGLSPKRARLASLRGLATGEALSLPYYRSAAMQDWVDEVAAGHRIEQVVVFSGVMAQYVDRTRFKNVFVDFCDVDSAKWTQYAQSRTWPMSWLYRREGRLLGEFERTAARAANDVSFVTAAECDLFLTSAPELRSRALAVENGVDTEFFSPTHGGTSPFSGEGPQLVMTGAMDYWPNIDGACWFAQDVMPMVRARFPDAAFTIVGMNPAPAVEALKKLPGVHVTGRVPDVRPYLHHADVVIAPLRIARGIQNKVLEAMAMGRPVVVSSASATGLRGQAGTTHELAEQAKDYVDAIERCLAAHDMGYQARALVIESYGWQAHLSAILQRLTEGARS